MIEARLRRWMNGLLGVMLGVTLGACAMESSESASTDRAVDAGADTAMVEDVTADSGGLPDAAPVCEPYEPTVDSDGDGLADAVEDQNRNCRVDDGETDPLVADTDGDGISDGDEDIDRNGRHDAARGELNPLRADTDGDGVMDRYEPLAAVCTPGLVMDFLDHRFALPDGWTAFVPPGSQVEILADGLGLAFFSSGSDEFTMLFRDVSLDVRAQDVLLAAREAAQGLGGDAWFTLQSHSDTTGVHIAEIAAEFPEPIQVATLFERIVGLPIPLPTSFVEGAAPTTRVQVRIEAEGPRMDSIRGHLAIMVRPGAIEGAQPRGCGIDCIASRAGERMVPFCQKAAMEPPEAGRLLVVLEPSSVSEPAVLEMVASVDRVLAERSARGVATDVWLASSEAHLVEGGSRSPAVRLLPGQRLGEVATSLSNAGSDERPWATTRAALAAMELEVGPDAGEPVVLIVGMREDTEFRVGETMGRDGNSERPPLLPGEQRDARTRYYIDELAAFDARILAVAPLGVRLGPVEWCASLTDDSLRAGVDDALSFTEISAGLHGSRMDACYPGAAAVIANELAALLEQAPHVSLSHHPIGPTMRVASREGVLPWSSFELSDGRRPGRAVLTAEVDREALGVAYLVWESAFTP